jgi:hypothetical protein
MIMAGFAACTVLIHTANAEIFYIDIRGHVRVNGELKEGVTVEVIPCDVTRLPSDWPSPPPGTVSTLPDPVTGLNYHLSFGSGFGDGTTSGPAGSFTFLALNGAWFTAVDTQLKFSFSDCPSVTVSCDEVRKAYEATLNDVQVGLAVLDLDISCPQFVPGDTATIGFWGNKNGQALIKSLNGGSGSTALANWLAANFSYLYGVNAGANNLTGKSNVSVISLYMKFLVSGQKVQAQIMAAALAAYVTDSDLAGNAGVHYGFNVSTTGTGEKTYNVGSLGSAIGLANDTAYSVLALLQQANLQKQLGTFNANAFNFIFSDINESGNRL